MSEYPTDDLMDYLGNNDEMDLFTNNNLSSVGNALEFEDSTFFFEGVNEPFGENLNSPSVNQTNEFNSEVLYFPKPENQPGIVYNAGEGQKSGLFNFNEADFNFSASTSPEKSKKPRRSPSPRNEEGYRPKKKIKVEKSRLRANSAGGNQGTNPFEQFLNTNSSYPTAVPIMNNTTPTLQRAPQLGRSLSANKAVQVSTQSTQSAIIPDLAAMNNISLRNLSNLSPTPTPMSNSNTPYVSVNNNNIPGNMTPNIMMTPQFANNNISIVNNTNNNNNNMLINNNNMVNNMKMNGINQVNSTINNNVIIPNGNNNINNIPLLNTPMNPMNMMNINTPHNINTINNNMNNVYNNNVNINNMTMNINNMNNSNLNVNSNNNNTIQTMSCDINGNMYNAVNNNITTMHTTPLSAVMSPTGVTLQQSMITIPNNNQEYNSLQPSLNTIVSQQPQPPMTNLTIPTLNRHTESDPSALLELTNLNYITRKDIIETMRSQQNGILSHSISTQNTIIVLEKNQKLLLMQVQKDLSDLNYLYSHSILSVDQLYSISSLLDDIKNQQIELELFYNELVHSRQSAALVIVKQPFPKVMYAGRSAEEKEEIIVKLICSPNFEHFQVGNMKISFIFENRYNQLKQSKGYQTIWEPFDPIHKLFKYNLKFQVGSRKSAVHVQFALPINFSPPPYSSIPSSCSTTLSPSGSISVSSALPRASTVPSSLSSMSFASSFSNQPNNNNNTSPTYGRSPLSSTLPSSLISLNSTPPQPTMVESLPSRSFVVNTSECQWEDAVGHLLFLDAFSDQDGLKWEHFANILQLTFMRSLDHREKGKLTRFLSPSDLAYIHDKFFNNQHLISSKNFENFWSWFGKILKRLKSNKFYLQFWQIGLIHGFLTRDSVQDLLKDEEVGAFVVRFSESSPGEIALAYRDKMLQTRHYLVRTEIDLGPKKFLSDFLYEQPSLLYIILIERKKCKKELLLEQFLSKKFNTITPMGYDSMMQYHSIENYQASKEELNAE